MAAAVTDSRFGQGTLQNYLGSMKTWLDQNENQVLTLLLVNGDGQPVSQFGDVFASAGLDSYAYTPPHTLKPSEWPTLQTLIDNNDRLVVFLGMSKDCKL
jgi:hypothetical protein